jgi:hypothetical protein
MILPYLVWPSIVFVPLLLTTNSLYLNVFPAKYYDTEPKDYWNTSEWPSPLGLSLGLLAVAVGQAFMLTYFIKWKSGAFGKDEKLLAVQKDGAPVYDVMEGLKIHLSQPEGFVLLGGYLSFTWMLGLMSPSYYSFSGGINWFHVLAQLLIQDFIQFVMHWLEHVVDKRLYRMTHKAHHRFTNPKLFDAFNGSFADTLFMIVIPLYITSKCVNANVWSYMAFGSLYANWLTLIHSEYKNPWDGMFRLIGFGTAADHHVHHRLFVFNFGHIFM